jgi:hypothetical protein
VWQKKDESNESNDTTGFAIDSKISRFAHQRAAAARS